MPVISMRRGPDQGDPGAVHAQPRHLAQRKAEVSQCEQNPSQQDVVSIRIVCQRSQRRVSGMKKTNSEAAAAAMAAKT